MDKFLFVLGSNWQLSIAELDAVLRNSRFKGRITDYSANIAVVQFDEIHEDRLFINHIMELQHILGGCQKIVQIHDFIYIKDLEDAFPSFMEKYGLVKKKRKKILGILEPILKKAFPRISNENLFFAVSIYPVFFDQDYYKDTLVKHFLPFLNKKIMKLLFKNGAKKALYFKYPKEKIDSGNLNPIFPHHLIKYGLFNRDRAEIVFGFTEEGVYIGRTISCDDPNFKKKIDEERPFREFKSSISPKLAEMMLNFLNLFDKRRKKKIIDPFVGNGTIPMMAIMQNFDVYGMDIDPKKVKNTIGNVNWLYDLLEEPKPSMLNERYISGNVNSLSEHYNNDFFDGMCTEPLLGPYFTEKPYYTQIQELIEDELEPMYRAVFEGGNKVLKTEGRICIISPIFEIIDGADMQIDIDRIAQDNNFKVIHIMKKGRIMNKSNFRLQFTSQHFKNLIDAKRKQIVKRKIHIFEKK